MLGLRPPPRVVCSYGYYVIWCAWCGYGVAIGWIYVSRETLTQAPARLSYHKTTGHHARRVHCNGRGVKTDPRRPLCSCVIVAGRGMSSDLTKCTNTKLTAINQYFTPLQFNALKSRGGFTSSNIGQTRRTQG